MRSDVHIDRLYGADQDSVLNGGFEIPSIAFQDVANAIPNGLVQSAQLHGQISEGAAQDNRTVVVLGNASEESIEALQWTNVSGERRLQHVAPGTLPLRIQYCQREITLGRKEIVEAALVDLRGGT